MEKQPSLEQIKVPQTKTLKNFWDGVVTGEYKPLTEEEISELIEKVYLSQPTLATLTEEEISNIKKSLEKVVKAITDNPSLKKLAEQEVFFLPPISANEISKMINSEEKARAGREDYPNENRNHHYPDRPAIEMTLDNGEKVKIIVNFSDGGENISSVQIEGVAFPINSPHFLMLSGAENDLRLHEEKKKEIIERNNKTAQIISRLGATILDKNQKIDKYSDVNIWSKAGSLRQVYRHLYKDEGGHEYNSYGYTKERFTSILSDIRKRTGREDISMLDVGGGMGTAAFEAEQLDNHLHATNLTIEEEPAMYPVETVLVPAEAMPVSFKGKYDLVVSNTSFRYFTYPDIAFENCLQALSVGGEAGIVFESDPRKAKEHNIKDFGLRLSKVYERLKRLRDGGFIEIKAVNSGPFPNPMTYELEEGSDDFPEAFVSIVKLKSLDERELSVS